MTALAEEKKAPNEKSPAIAGLCITYLSPRQTLLILLVLEISKSTAKSVGLSTFAICHYERGNIVCRGQ